MKRFSVIILGFLLGLASVQSIGLRAGGYDFQESNEVVQSLFGGLAVRKIEVRSPISGILSKVNIHQTGYHSSGTAYVVTAESSQYYKSTVNSGGRNISVKRVIEGGRNVYIQIFRDSFVTFYTTKSVGENVSQFDLLAILYVVKTRQGEAPVVKKLPRSVPTLPISNPMASSTTVELETADTSLESRSVQESEPATAEEPVDLEKEEGLQLPVESSPTVEAERVSELPQTEETPEMVDAQEQQEVMTEKIETAMDDLTSIPERSELETTATEEETGKDNDFSELSDFASDSEESKGASSSQKPEVEPEPASVVSSESGSQLIQSEMTAQPSESAGSEEIQIITEEQKEVKTGDLEQGEAVETETKSVEISEIVPTTTEAVESETEDQASAQEPAVSEEQFPEVESPIESPIGSPVESPTTEQPTESPVESPIESPIESPLETPTDIQPKEEEKEEPMQGLPSEPMLRPSEEQEPIEESEEPDSEPSDSNEVESAVEENSLESAGRMIGSDVDNSGSNTGDD